ncbi:MAG: hypothetical protein HW375_1740, partial [Anaerolineales bacterium]|nr:hypothetical protein [Anaerolineales bacterium]
MAACGPARSNSCAANSKLSAPSWGLQISFQASRPPRRPDILEVLGQVGQRLALGSTKGLSVGPLKLPGEVGSEATHDGRTTIRIFGRLLRRVHSQHFVRLETIGAGPMQQRLVDQRRQVGRLRLGHRPSGLEGEAAAEHREPTIAFLLGGRQPRPRVLEDGPQAALPLGQIAVGAAEKVETPFDLLGHLSHAVGRGPRPSHLQRQRQPVDAAADPANPGQISLRQRESGTGPDGALDEELLGGRGLPRRVARLGVRQPLDFEHALPQHPQRRPRGRDELDGRGRREQFSEEGGGFHQVLEVVEHEEKLAVPQVPDQLAPHFRAGSESHLQRPGHSRDQLIWTLDSGERHKTHSVQEIGFGPGGGLNRQAGLADSPGSHQSQQATAWIDQLRAQLLQLLASSHQSRGRRREIAHPVFGCRSQSIVEIRRLEGWVDAELGLQEVAAGLVLGQPKRHFPLAGIEQHRRAMAGLGQRVQAEQPLHVLEALTVLATVQPNGRQGAKALDRLHPQPLALNRAPFFKTPRLPDEETFQERPAVELKRPLDEIGLRLRKVPFGSLHHGDLQFEFP